MDEMMNVKRYALFDDEGKCTDISTEQKDGYIEISGGDYDKYSGATGKQWRRDKLTGRAYIYGEKEQEIAALKARNVELEGVIYDLAGFAAGLADTVDTITGGEQND